MQAAKKLVRKSRNLIPEFNISNVCDKCNMNPIFLIFLPVSLVYSLAFTATALEGMKCVCGWEYLCFCGKKNSCKTGTNIACQVAWKPFQKPCMTYLTTDISM